MFFFNPIRGIFHLALKHAGSLSIFGSAFFCQGIVVFSYFFSTTSREKQGARLNFPWPARIKEKPAKTSSRSSSTKGAIP